MYDTVGAKSSVEQINRREAEGWWYTKKMKDAKKQRQSNAQTDSNPNNVPDTTVNKNNKIQINYFILGSNEDYDRR